MKLLVVLRPNEADWEDLLKTLVEKEGGNVVIKHSVEEAQALLEDRKFSVSEIISGSFGTLDGPWRQLQKIAREREMGISLLTGLPISQGEREELNKQNVQLIEKNNFDRREFIERRFPTRAQKEIR